MTVATALGHQDDDTPALHFDDTVAAGRSLVHEPLAALLCDDAPQRILETRTMGVGWAADGERLCQVGAPGHSRRRCCYVDPLATGTALSRGLKSELRRCGAAARANCFATELIVDRARRVVGVAAFNVTTGEPVAVWTTTIVLACGGLTELYRRTSASRNMTGDVHALAMKAGAEVLDIKLVQFFPIANLAPRLIGLNPIMWDPFRYKLGGRLLNGLGEEFVGNYADAADEGHYRATRDVLTYAILKEVEAGRSSPNGGAWLDFTFCTPAQLRDAFPPVVDKLLAQGIDLTTRPVEVAPMAHYALGGLRVDASMHTTVPGLYAAGEAVGGAHGANRLSGNAIAEALVFGASAGRHAAREALSTGRRHPDSLATSHMAAAFAAQAPPSQPASDGRSLPQLRRSLQDVMWAQVGPLRTEEGLRRAASALEDLAREVAVARVTDTSVFNLEWVEWLEMRNMIETARAVQLGAVERRESRGAHQREDFPRPAPEARSSVIRLQDGHLEHDWIDVTHPSSVADTYISSPGLVADADTKGLR